MARGGARPGAGRRKGATDKIRADIRALAADYGAGAIKALADIAMGEDQPSAARVSAANALLDRGFGKPSQFVELTGKDGGPMAHTSVTPAQLSEAVRDVVEKF